jgi:LemA protein
MLFRQRSRKEEKMSLISIIFTVILLLILYVIFLYNRFIRQENLCAEGWSGIDVQLKRRYDLIPNLLATVKGYAGYEQATLEKIVRERSAAMQAATPEEKAKAENLLTSSLKSIFALAENYPDLKASQNFLHFQETLADIEDNLQNARRYYNATVRSYNTMVGTFPSNLIARRFNFTDKEFFNIDEAEKAPVKVSFE